MTDSRKREEDGPKRVAADAIAHDEATGSRSPSGSAAGSPLQTADAGFVRLGQALGSVVRRAEAGIKSIGKKQGFDDDDDAVDVAASPRTGAEHDPLEWLDELPPDVRAVVEQELAHLQREELGLGRASGHVVPPPVREGREAAATRTREGGPTKEASPPRERARVARPAEKVAPPAAPATPSERRAAPAAPATPSERRAAAAAPATPSERRAAAAAPATPSERRAESAIDVEAWVARVAAGDTVRAMAIRLAVDDWLRGSQDARRDAAQVLISVGPEAEGLFLGLLQGASGLQAELALEALLQLGSSRFLARLRALSRDQDPGLRMAAYRVAQRLEGPGADALLTQASEDPSLDVRQRAVQWLSWREEPWAQDRLWEMCDDAAPEVRWAAVRAMIARDATNMRWRIERAKASDPARALLVTAMLEASEKRSKQGVRDLDSAGDEQKTAAQVELAARLVELGRTRASRRDDSTHQTEVGETESWETREALGVGASPRNQKEFAAERAEAAPAGVGARTVRSERKGGSAGGES